MQHQPELMNDLPIVLPIAVMASLFINPGSMRGTLRDSRDHERKLLRAPSRAPVQPSSQSYKFHSFSKRTHSKAKFCPKLPKPIKSKSKSNPFHFSHVLSTLIRQPAARIYAPKSASALNLSWFWPRNCLDMHVTDSTLAGVPRDETSP